MVCKEDVITWFKEATSYRRIDVMCSLLNMCVPFELRYLGTCIEEQGKHDYQELRGAALTANNIEKLAKEFSTFKGLLDKCARHRLTIYVSLLQSRNYSCANWMYNALLRTENFDTYVANNNLYKDVILHTELLLLFTLALNHPAFTFEQKRYFGHVVSQLTEPEVPIQPTHNHPPCPPGLGYIKPPLPVHHIPPVVAKCQLGALPLTETPMPPPGIPLPPVHGEFVGAPTMWSRAPFINASCPPPPADLAAFPTPISPLVSQQSSPTPSRSVSPTRIYSCRLLPHPPPMAPIAHLERLQPPLPAVKDPALLPTPQYNTDLKTIPIEEVHGGERDNNPQQPWMESMVRSNKIRNGLLPGLPIALPVQKCPTTNLPEFQSLSLDGDVSLRCTSSSDSCNSSECQTPPDTPTESVVPPPHGPGRGLMNDLHTNKLRNGGATAASGGGGNGANVPPPGLPVPVSELGSVAGNNATLYTSTCTVPYTTHYSVPPPPQHTSSFHNRSFLFSHSPAYRPQFPAYQQNGEISYIFNPHYLPVIYSSAVPPPPKITCCNCGLPGHIGSECKEPNIEEITQKKGYQLDYTSPPPDAPPPAEKQ